MNVCLEWAVILTLPEMQNTEDTEGQLELPLLFLLLNTRGCRVQIALFFCLSIYSGDLNSGCYKEGLTLNSGTFLLKLNFDFHALLIILRVLFESLTLYLHSNFHF